MPRKPAILEVTRTFWRGDEPVPMKTEFKQASLKDARELAQRFVISDYQQNITKYPCTYRINGEEYKPGKRSGK